MDSVVRAAAVYLALLLLFRIVGKRTLAETGVFDFVLLLIIAEATQQGLLGDDFSVTKAIIVIVTLVVLDRGFDALSHRSDTVDKWLNDVPIVIIDNGELLEERMAKEKIGVDDVLEHARQSQGIERLEQIKYAILERNGGISIVPAEAAAGE